MKATKSWKVGRVGTVGKAPGRPGMPKRQQGATQNGATREGTAPFSFYF